jgi:hypothetical protein
MVAEKLLLQEDSLQLVVNKKTLGSLTTNAKQIKTLVEKALPNYDISNYSEDNIDDAKKDKAMLNKSAKTLNSKRLEIEKEFVKPFAEFKDTISETVKLIAQCSSKIDVVVQKSIEKYRNEKRAEIQSHFDTHKNSLISLDKIFDEKWLNKTSKPKNIYSEVDAKIAKVSDDILTLEAIGEDVDLLKSLYLDTLNINSTIQYSKTLKDNREKAKQEAENRVIEKAKEPVQEENPFEQPVQKVKLDPIKKVVDEILTRSFKVTASKDKIIALGNFMNENGIEFQKIELCK